MWITTFHSACLRILRRNADKVGLRSGFGIYDDGDQMRVLRRIVESTGKYDRVDARMVRTRIDQAKNKGIGPQEFSRADWVDDVVARVFPLYQDALRRANAVDFSDLLLLTMRLLEDDKNVRDYYRGKFQHVLVDEFQDTNLVQYRIVSAIVGEKRNVAVVGDDDQAIYGWRGADVGNILGFARDYPDARIVLLEQNYRSTANILAAAGAVVAKNRTRQPKTLYTEEGDGPLLTWLELGDEHEEARTAVEAAQALVAREGYAWRDCAFFVRVGAQTRVLEEALRFARVPHRVIGAMRFYERAEVQDAMAYLRALRNPEDDVALERILNVPARGIGKSTEAALKAYAAFRGGTLWDAIAAAAEGAPLAAAAGELKPAARKRLGEFRALMVALRAEAARVPPSVLMKEVLVRSGYLKSLQEEGSDEAEGRAENLQELLQAAEQFESAWAHEVGEGKLPELGDYLDGISLQSDQDLLQGADDYLPVMTVHAAKGLEFQAVFLIGMEEGIFPHMRSIQEPGREEEERRLAYVAITRARQYLFFTTAQWRTLAGAAARNQPSRYLRDIAPELIHRPLARATDPHLRGRAPVTVDEVEAAAWGAARERAGAWIDRSDAQDEDAPAAGARVRHVRFGVGEVTAVRGDKVTVRFPGVGLKTILGSHLERV
jgi:DNA helicase-2/ATP-dependent DNA helicase PcrA